VCILAIIGYGGAVLKNGLTQNLTTRKSRLYNPTLCYVDANNVLTQIKAAL
jgi:hypothetical protein